MQTESHSRSAFTLVEIMIVVGIIALLAAMAIPNFVKARLTAQKNGCVNTLKLIDSAKEQWVFENKKSQGDSTAGSEVAINGFMKGAAVCPGGGVYTYNSVGTSPTCSLGPTLSHTF